MIPKLPIEKPLPFRVQAHNTKIDFQKFATLEEALDAIVSSCPKFPVVLDELHLATSKNSRPRYQPIARSEWQTQFRVYEDPSWGYDPTEGPMYGTLCVRDKHIRWKILP
jgi:hypothetical protein